MVDKVEYAQADRLITALRNGEESAFAYLVDCYHAAMVRVALLYCRDPHVAEEVAQETWLAVLKGLAQFEGRSSIKTWIFSILCNKAKTRGQREGRTVAFSDLVSQLEGSRGSGTGTGTGTGADEGSAADDEVIDAARFKADGWWTDAGHPSDWNVTPEEAYQSAEIRDCVRRTIATLPLNQQQVITLRDFEGLESDNVCNILNISETNQRVLLHRARAKVRNALESYFGKH